MGVQNSPPGVHENDERASVLGAVFGFMYADLATVAVTHGDIDDHAVVSDGSLIGGS